MASAVSDYTPIETSEKKIKRSSNDMVLQLKQSSDILKSISDKTNAIITAFALETHDGENEALRKLKSKDTDFIILNYANEIGSGFESSTNRVIIFSKQGAKKELKKNRKDRIAEKIIIYILEYLEQNKTVLNS